MTRTALKARVAALARLARWEYPSPTESTGFLAAACLKRWTAWSGIQTRVLDMTHMRHGLKRWTAWSGIQTYPQVALIHNPLYKKPPSLWITFAAAIQVALERARQPIQIWIGIALRPRARGLT